MCGNVRSSVYSLLSMSKLTVMRASASLPIYSIYLKAKRNRFWSVFIFTFIHFCLMLYLIVQLNALQSVCILDTQFEKSLTFLFFKNILTCIAICVAVPSLVVVVEDRFYAPFESPAVLGI